MTTTSLSRADLIRALSRWNRWGGARLDAGHARDLTARLLRHLDTPEVIALIGPRRAGKTTVLFQLMDALEAAGAPREALLHVNLEEPGFGAHLGLDLLERIYDTWRSEVFPEGRGWLFLDEIQRVPAWERWVRARSETEDVKVFVTGSSSALMSSELATLLTGRHLTFRVLPLSFREALRFRGLRAPSGSRLADDPAPIRNAVAEYLRWGGFPEVVLTPDTERKKELLRQYFDDTLFKDVALRHEIRDLPLLRNLAVYLLGQTASLISFQRLATIFEISKTAVSAYCRHLEEAYLVSFLPFYTLKSAERLRRPSKVHAIDPGLRNAISLSGAPDRGRLMETAVHNALLGEDSDGLFYWKGQGEVDLAVRRGLGIERLIQVTDEGLLDPVSRRREIEALVEASCVFPGAELLVVAGALPPPGLEELGVRTVAVGRFLTEGIRAGRRDVD
jgi:predicted AAA+ superfamily ATPase